MCASTSVVFASGRWRCTLAVAFTYRGASTQGCSKLRKLLNVWLKLDLRYMAVSKATDIHTHACAQCSPSSVGLTHAHPNQNQQYVIQNRLCLPVTVWESQKTTEPTVSQYIVLVSFWLPEFIYRKAVFCWLFAVWITTSDQCLVFCLYTIVLC